jgi:hypothetical protein
MSTPVLSRYGEALECIRLIITSQEQIAQGAAAHCLKVAPDSVAGGLDNNSAVLTKLVWLDPRFGGQTNRADRDGQIAYLDILDHVGPSGGSTAPIPPGLAVRVKPASVGQAAHDSSVPATAVTAPLGSCGRRSLSTVVNRPEEIELRLEADLLPVVNAHVSIPAGERREGRGAGCRQPFEVQAQPCAETALTGGTPSFSMLLSKPRGSHGFDF